MQPGCGALLLIGLLAGVPAVSGAQESKQRLPSRAYAALPEMPVIACDVSSVSVSAGESISVTTRVVKGDAARLRYSFESSAGRLTVTGSTARLDTADVSAAEVNVTCVAIDVYGRKVSYGKAIRLVKAKMAEIVAPSRSSAAPAKPLPMQQATEVPATLAPKPGAPSKISSPDARTGEDTVAPATGTNRAGGGADLGAILGGILGEGKGGKTGAAVGGAVGGGSHTVTRGHAPISAAGTTPPVVAGSNEYAEGLAIQEWEKQLKSGKIEYNLPTKMSLPDATTVSVVVHGYEDVNGPVAAGAQSAALKVSQRMRVVLSAEGNPNEFKIEPMGTDEVQLIPIDGTARWQWKVTPKEPATNQTLTIRALLVYPDDPNKADVQITSYTAEVSVQVGSLWEWVKYLFWNDPMGLLKYLLPGGAGFAFVAGLVVWWWKRRHPEKKE